MSENTVIESPPGVPARPAGLGSLGSNSFVFEPYTIFSPHRVHIGDDVLIGPGAMFTVIEHLHGVDYEPTLRIGDGCRIGRDAVIGCVSEVVIGNKVGISTRVFICDSHGDYSDPSTPTAEMPHSDSAPVRIGDGAHIGLGSTVLTGITVGERAFVGAGSVVTRDVPPRTVVFGNPARIIRSWDEKKGEWVSGPLAAPTADQS